MSGYRIVLNLTGNASKKVDRLANDLVRADVAAGSLARNLGRVAAASRGVGRIRSGSYGSPTGAPHYTRHRSTRILSYGTGFNVGGFSGRFSNILQPDASGNIMGMNANRLMRGANIASLATTLVTKVAKVAMKTIATATITPLAIGGGGMLMAIRALQSESFAEGVRLISRRHQAKLGLGADFERGQSSADFLSKAYGFDRSTTLSSINVLSGMGVGGTARKLSVGEATGLTKVGGLISQQSGVSFERVMTNIQQLLVQTTPHVRDIREMLNQAPILGKYALKDMEEKGVVGVDVRTWMKDQGNILSALKRFELDLATNAGMQARGQISLAQQDFWAKIASNDQFWRYVGYSGSGMIGASGNAMSGIMTMLSNNDAFKVMVKRVELTFEEIAGKGVNFFDKLIVLIDQVANKFDIDLVDKSAARRANDIDNAIDNLSKDSRFRTNLISAAEGRGHFMDVPASVRGQAEENLVQDFIRKLKTSGDFRSSVVGAEPLTSVDNARSKWAKQNREMLNTRSFKDANDWHNQRSLFYTMYSTGKGKIPSRRNRKDPLYENALYKLPLAGIAKERQSFLDEMLATGSFDPASFQGGAEAGGSDLSGFNRDRRALQIHFNAPIVEWESNIETSSPQETVELVQDNIEQIASAAIQKALLGATNKMSTRF